MNTAPAGPRLLIYSQDGLGLGHLRRTNTWPAVPVRLPRRVACCVSDSPLGTFFGMAPNQDYLKLPSIVKSRPRGSGARAPVVADPARPAGAAPGPAPRRGAQLRARPVLVDHMPHGALGELLPTLEALRGPPRASCSACGTSWTPRRSFGAAGRSRAPTTRSSVLRPVLVYGNRTSTTSRQLRHGPGSWPTACTTAATSARRTRRSRRGGCGPVPQRQPRPSSDRGHGRRRRRRLPADGRRSWGRCRRITAAALPPSRSSPDRSCPRACSAERCRLQASGSGVKIRTSVQDVLSYIAAADVVVGMAGYNTTVEILRMATPGVLVPAGRPQRRAADAGPAVRRAAAGSGGSVPSR